MLHLGVVCQVWLLTHRNKIKVHMVAHRRHINLDITQAGRCVSHDEVDVSLDKSMIPARTTPVAQREVGAS